MKSILIILPLLLCLAQASTMTVTLLVFSGSGNPTWKLTEEQDRVFRDMAAHSYVNPKPTYNVVGYSGFIVLDPETNTKHRLIGAPDLEFFLLYSAPATLFNDNVRQYVATKIRYGESRNENSVCSRTGALCGVWGGVDHHPCCPGSTCRCQGPKCFCFADDITLLSGFRKNSNGVNCSATPIRGPDTPPPRFDPEHDVGGCFIEKVWNNNCYNYGNDVLTNTFAQPGEATGQHWTENTCEAVRKAAESDGLKWVGTTLPSQHPPEGHWISLHIWPDTNFHWVRRDIDGSWSHKPGGRPVTNTDNSGRPITDPAQANMSPWTEFCGYMLGVPSKVNIA